MEQPPQRNVMSRSWLGSRFRARLRPSVSMRELSDDDMRRLRRSLLFYALLWAVVSVALIVLFGRSLSHTIGSATPLLALLVLYLFIFVGYFIRHFMAASSSTSSSGGRYTSRVHILGDVVFRILARWAKIHLYS